MFDFYVLILARLMWISLACIMYSSFNLCHVHFCMLVFCLYFSLFSLWNSAFVMCAFKFVLCAVCSRWLAASRLAARFTRVARFASQALSGRFARLTGSCFGSASCPVVSFGDQPQGSLPQRTLSIWQLLKIVYH